ncbi:hypothetical protein BX666DRAFT_2022811 [Dichotomocladium elegans]|nr:hypothetical protein BX666DRAFT_2022811 [Dichotomocladium elegans]
MFLEWMAQLQLLEHDPQTNILGSLPLSTRRVLVSEITNYLFPPAGKTGPDPAFFTSPAHVKWFMEVIGQGFNLPLEDMDIAASDVCIYSQWLLEPTMRPAIINTDGLEQEFYQVIFHQLSLIFKPRTLQPRAAAPATPVHNYNPIHTLGRPGSFSLGINVPVTQTAGHSTSNAKGGTGDSAAQMVHKHIELCKKTLMTMADAGRTLAMSEETWIVLLKVVLGVTDSLLRKTENDEAIAGVPNMSDELCECLLKVLFELWLRSETRQVEMWEILKSCIMRWIHRPLVIQQWISCCTSLTNKVVNMLYGPGEGTDLVILSTIQAGNITLDLGTDFVQYAWYKTLHLIPHPLQLPPSNFTLVIQGIGKLVDIFIQVGKDKDVADRYAEVPDGCTILHLFGSYLFDACSAAPSTNPEAERGCAEALATLCKIFCQKQRSKPFLRTYVERFYAALCVGLKSDGCLPTILVHSTELFASDLEGVRMLAPEFVAAIKMVLPKLQINYTGHVGLDELRLAAIKVVSTIMCLPNHFDKMELQPGWDWDLQYASDSTSALGEQEQIVTQLVCLSIFPSNELLEADGPKPRSNTDFPNKLIEKLKYYILELLLTSLRTETSSYNMRYLLHLINVYVVEDVPFCSGLVGTVVKLIEEKILTMQLPPDVTLVAFDVLIDFVDLYDYVRRDNKSVARELVLALSRYVVTLITAGKLSNCYPLIVQAYDCMMKWILTGHWIIGDRDCYQAVLVSLSKGIAIFDSGPEIPQTSTNAAEKKKRKDTAPPKQLFQLPPRPNKSSQSSNPSLPTGSNNSRNYKKEKAAVRQAAEYCMSQFINYLGRAGFAHEQLNQVPEDIKMLRRERLLGDKSDSRECWESRDGIRYFLVDKRRIISVYDENNNGATPEKHVPAIKAIIRETTGRYVWSIESRYKDPETVSLPPTPMDEVEPTLSQGHDYSVTWGGPLQFSEAPTAAPINSDALPSMEHLVEENSKSWSEWELIKSTIEHEQRMEMREAKEVCRDPAGQYDAKPAESKFNPDLSRGFRLLLAEVGLFQPNHRDRITPLKITDTLIAEIEMLDMLNDRDCISVSAYYAHSGHATWDELVETPPLISEQFLQFLNCMGWTVNLDGHVGYKGKLDPTVCKTAPYYADRNVEFLVNVPYLLQRPSSSNGTWEDGCSISEIHRIVSSDDHVCIVWIEDLDNYTALAKEIKQSGSASELSMVYIFVHPLKNSASGLYWIRIHIPLISNNAISLASCERLYENALVFGPLVDGMIVSRHVLGTMVRNTAISAHQACRVVMDTYRRPYLARKQFIEGMADRHRIKLQLSE